MRPVTAPARAGSRLAAGAARVTAKPAATGAYLVQRYLLYWYKSTNPDACGAACQALPALINASSLALLVQKFTSTNTDA